MNQNIQQTDQTPISPPFPKDISKREKIKRIVFVILTIILGVLSVVGTILYAIFVMNYDGSFINPGTIVLIALSGFLFYCVNSIISGKKWAFVTITIITVILILLNFYLMFLNL